MHHATAHFLIACGLYLASVSVGLWRLELTWLSPGPALMAASFYPGREILDRRANGFWDVSGLLAPTIPFFVLEAVAWCANGIPPASWWAPIAVGSGLLGGAVRNLQKTHNWRAGPNFVGPALTGICFLALALFARVS